MSIASSGAHQEMIGGLRRPMVLRNGEIERFEVQHAPVGIFTLWDQLFGRGEPQVRHVRDLVALGLVGGGMADREADELIASLGPQENFALRGIAQRLIGITFLPASDGASKKKRGGSRRAQPPGATGDTGRETASETSAA